MTAGVQSSFVSCVVDAIHRVVGDSPAALHEPRFAGNEWQYLKECLDSTYVSSVGKFVDRFEAELAEYTGANHVIAVVNGSAALHVSLLLAGVQPNDEVLIPAMSFVATANAVSYCSATPHFVDSDPVTLGMATDSLRDYLVDVSDMRSGQCVNRQTGRIIRALIPMHTFGHPVDIEGLMSMARDFNLVLIEDAAEALGSTRNGQHAGTFGLMGTLSFNGNKTITTGGGGAILTNDIEIAKKAKHLTTTAKSPHRWNYTHDQIGFNYRLPNLNAALGCAQLEQLPGFLLSKRNLFDRYSEEFSGISGAKIVVEPDGCRSNYWLQALLLEDTTCGERDSILAATNDAGLMTRPVWTLLNQLQPYADCPAMPLTIAGSLAQRLINLPSSPGIMLKNRDQ